MRKVALASSLTLLLSLSATPTHLDGSFPGSSSRAAGSYIPPATDFIYPVGDPRIAPTFDQNGPNGYQITQMFNNSCNPSLGQGFYYAGQYFCGHTGVDLSDRQEGGQVHAIANGLVVYAGYNSSYGEMVRIQHLLPDGTYIYSQYEHMEWNSLTVSPGEVVTMGQVIGLVGTTGFVTGAHLHFEVKSVNEDGVGYTFGNSALIVGYYEPISYVASHTAHLDPTPTPTLPPPTNTATATATATDTPQPTPTMAHVLQATATTAPPTATPVSPTPSPTVTSTMTAPPSQSTTAKNGGESRAVLNNFYKRYHDYVTVISQQGGLNVRSGPDMSFPVLNSVQRGARLGFLGLNGRGWVHVALPSNVTGYVARQWVEGRPLPPLPPVVASGALKPPYVTVLDSLYPARSGPMMHDPPIETLYKGEKLTYLGSHVSWDKVLLPTGRLGWVNNWYLTRPEMGVSRDRNVTPSHQTTKRARRAEPRTASSSRTVQAAGPFVVTTVEGLNMRSGPRLAAPVITSFHKGTKLGFRGYHVSWASVVAPDGTRGYVLARYITPPSTVASTSTPTAPAPSSRSNQRNSHPVSTTQASTTSGTTRTASTQTSRTVAPRVATKPAQQKPAPGYGAPYVTVTVTAARLHNSPDEKALVLGLATRGTRLSVHGTRGNWIDVETRSGMMAWIRSDLAS